MKKLSILALLILCLILPSVAFADSDGIGVYLDGEKIEFDVNPQVINERTMVPIRAIFERMGAYVEWDNDTNTAYCTKDDIIVMMSLDSPFMYVNDQIITMDVCPAVVNERILTPARYVAEAFGANVDWDSYAKNVIISTGAYVPEKIVTMYAMDGRTIDVPESEVEAYKNVGWYMTLQETQQTMYAADGRTIVVFKSEVPAYKNVGWYETQYEANAANTASRPSYNTNTTPSYNTSYESNNSGGSAVYKTPTGKKYHFDPDCGGKNSTLTTLEKAKNLGLKPCSKCAY